MTKISDLNHYQLSHLAWRLDSKTACGALTAVAVAQGKHGDLDLVEVFEKYGDRSRRSALIHARFVEQYVIDKKEQEVVDLVMQATSILHNMAKRLTGKQTIAFYKHLIDGHKISLSTFGAIDWET